MNRVSSAAANSARGAIVTRRHRPRGGFTLLEISLVLAVLVVVAALAAPIYQQTLRVERVRKGAESLRADWGRAQGKAMKSGITQLWTCSVADRRYSTSPYEAGVVTGTGTGPSPSSATPSPLNDSSSSTNQRQLDEELEISEILISEGDSVTTMAELTSAGDEGTVSLFFYPDGSSSSARLVIRDTKFGHPFAVVLHGLAGTTRLVRLSKEGAP